MIKLIFWTFNTNFPFPSWYSDSAHSTLLGQWIEWNFNIPLILHRIFFEFCQVIQTEYLSLSKFIELGHSPEWRHCSARRCRRTWTTTSCAVWNGPCEAAIAPSTGCRWGSRRSTCPTATQPPSGSKSVHKPQTDAIIRQLIHQTTLPRSDYPTHMS